MMVMLAASVIGLIGKKPETGAEMPARGHLSSLIGEDCGGKPAWRWMGVLNSGWDGAKTYQARSARFDVALFGPHPPCAVGEQDGELKPMPQKCNKGPIQLAWMVNKIPRLAAIADNLLHHPHKADGVVDYADFFGLAHHLLHHPGKLDGVERATSKRRFALGMGDQLNFKTPPGVGLAHRRLSKLGLNHRIELNAGRREPHEHSSAS